MIYGKLRGVFPARQRGRHISPGAWPVAYQVGFNITICVGSSCSMCGADDLAAELIKYIEKEDLEATIRIAGSFCMDTCFNAHGVSVRVGDREFRSIRPSDAEAFFNQEIKSLFPEKRN